MPKISEPGFDICFTLRNRGMEEIRISILDGFHLKLDGDRKITSRVNEASICMLLLRLCGANLLAQRLLFVVLVSRVPTRPSRDCTDDQSHENARQS